MQALWMVLASLLFATMGVCVKIASDTFNSAELVFWRGVIGVVFMWALARAQGVSLATRYPGMHAWRSAIGVFSLGAWFYAIAHLPLATAMTLNYMSSVWIAAFLVGAALLAWNPLRTESKPSSDAGPPQGASAPPGGSAAATVGATVPPPGRPKAERSPSGGSDPQNAGSVGATFAQGPLVLTVLAGFAGVVMMLRPTIDSNQGFAGLVGLLSGFGAAFAYLQVMALAKAGEPEARTVFYFAVGTVIAGGLGLFVTGISPWQWKAALWLIPIGVLASVGQLCMTRAYSSGSTLVVANLQYSGIVFAALYSLLLFGDQIPLIGWAGMALIVASGIAATVLRSRAAPGSPAEEH
jgi:S-adenosylmethionine uptake transporter